MSKVVICAPTTAEIDEYIQILQNIEALSTLMQIKREKNKLNQQIRTDIEKKIRSKTIEMSEWWEMITDKYNIPYHNSHSMYIDTLKGLVFVDEID